VTLFNKNQFFYYKRVIRGDEERMCRSSLGIAIIVWDYEGAVLVAYNTTKTLLVEAVVAEGLTAVHVVEFCTEMSFFFEIILEVDTLQIVNVVKVRGYNWSEMGLLINEIKDGLGKLKLWNIEYVKRDANNAAHFLARKEISSVINRVWIE
jgi:hypothetical protein